MKSCWRSLKCRRPCPASATRCTTTLCARRRNGVRILHTPSEPQVWKVWDPVFLHALRRRIATILHSLAVTVRLGCAKIAGSAHDDFTDLNDRRLVGVLWDICHNLRSVSAKTGLEFLNRLAENVAHPDVRSGSAGRSARKALVHGVVLARFTQSIFHQGHVLVPVIVVVEAGARHICIHNTYLNHDHLLIGAARFSSGGQRRTLRQICAPCNLEGSQVGIHSCGQSRRGDRRFAAQSTVPPTQAAWLSCCCSGKRANLMQRYAYLQWAPNPSHEKGRTAPLAASLQICIFLVTRRFSVASMTKPPRLTTLR